MEYKREVLSKINLHDLRTIGRDIGVKAPTALKKGVLIQEIIKIQSGEKKPHISSKVGRPPSLCVDSIENVEAQVNKENVLDIIKIKKQAKKEFIKTILQEIENKLNKIL